MTKYSRIDLGSTPPGVHHDQAYNAAVDIVERHGTGENADKTCLIDDDGNYTYAELTAAMNRAGNMLDDLGMQAEQRVVMCMTDGIDFAAVFFGAIKAGYVAVPLNTMLTGGDYDYILRDSRAPVLVVSEQLLETFAPLFDGLPHLRHVIVAGGGPDGAYEDLASLLSVASAELPAAATTADDIAFWLYSSGSTGRPKGRRTCRRTCCTRSPTTASPCSGCAPTTWSIRRRRCSSPTGSAIRSPCRFIPVRRRW